MAWYIGSIRVFVQEEDETAKQIIARLQPLGGGTTHHIFGYEDDIFKISGYLVGSGESQTLKGYAQDGNAHTLQNPFYGNLSFYVSTVSVKPQNFISQTIDTTKPCDEPVYRVDVELFLMPSLYASISGVTNPINISVQSNHGSSVATAQVECISTTKDIGDTISIDLGFTSSHGTVFNGYIKSKTRKVPDNTYILTCNDVMIRAIDYFIVSSNPETPFSRQNISAEDLIQDLLQLAGLTDFDFGNTSFTLAISTPAEVNLISAYDYAKSIADYVAWHLWADESETIHFKNRKPYVMEAGGPDSSQPGFAADSSFKTITDASILDFSLDTHERDLRNRVVVYGMTGVYADADRATSYNPLTSSFEQVLPNGFYKTIAAAVPFIDSNSMAQKAADYNLELYNRIQIRGNLSVLGDYTLQARKVITVNDSFILGGSETFYIFSAEHNWSRGGYVVNMELRK